MTEFIIDTPDGIKAFAMLQLYHKMKLVIANPRGPQWRQNPFTMARAELIEAGKMATDKNPRRKTIFDAYEKHLRDLGVLND
jgi:hypothetical protein